MGQRNRFQSQGVIQAPSAAQIGQSVGQGQVQSPQARMSRTQGRVYVVVPEAKHADQLDEQGTFLLSHLLTRVAFKLDASNSFIVASCVIELGLEVEAFRVIMGNSSLGYRVRVSQMCRDRESRISVILFVVDHRVIDILGVDVILDMDKWTVIGLSVSGTLAGLSYPIRSWS